MSSKKSASKYATKATKDNPIRCGKLEYYVGARLEAMDSQQWYISKVVKINESSRKVLVHFDGWNSRHDKWLGFDNELLRPISKQTAKDHDGFANEKDFHAGDYVAAKWSNARHYPARILKVFNETMVEVEFYDGFKKVLSKSSLKADKKKTFDTRARKFQEEACQPSIFRCESTPCVQLTPPDDGPKRIRRQHAGPAAMSDFVTTLPVKRSRKGEDDQASAEKSATIENVYETEAPETSFIEPEQKRQKLQFEPVVPVEPVVPFKKHHFWKLHMGATKISGKYGESDLKEHRIEAQPECHGKSDVKIKNKHAQISVGDCIPPGEETYPPISRKRKKPAPTLKIKLNLKRLSRTKLSSKKETSNIVDTEHLKEIETFRKYSEEKHCSSTSLMKDVTALDCKESQAEVEQVKKPIVVSPREGQWRAPKPAVVKGKGRLPQDKGLALSTSEVSLNGCGQSTNSQQHLSSTIKQGENKVDIADQIQAGKADETESTSVSEELDFAVEKINKHFIASTSSCSGFKTIENSAKESAILEHRKFGRRERKLTEKGLEIQQLLKKKEEERMLKKKEEERIRKEEFRIKKYSKARTISALDCFDERKSFSESISSLDDEVFQMNRSDDENFDNEKHEDFDIEQGTLLDCDVDTLATIKDKPFEDSQNKVSHSDVSKTESEFSSDLTDMSSDRLNESFDLSPSCVTAVKQIERLYVEGSNRGKKRSVLLQFDQFRKSLADKIKKHEEESLDIKNDGKLIAEHDEDRTETTMTCPESKPSLALGEDGVIRVVVLSDDVVGIQGMTDESTEPWTSKHLVKEVDCISSSLTAKTTSHNDPEFQTNLDKSSIHLTPGETDVGDNDKKMDDVGDCNKRMVDVDDSDKKMEASSPLKYLTKMLTLQNLKEVSTIKEEPGISGDKNMSEKEINEVFIAKSLKKPEEDRHGRLTEKASDSNMKVSGKFGRPSSGKRQRSKVMPSFVSMVIQDRPSQVKRKLVRKRKTRRRSLSDNNEAKDDNHCDDPPKMSHDTLISIGSKEEEETRDTMSTIPRVKPSPLGKLKLRKGSYQSLTPPSRKQILAAKIQKRIRGVRYQIGDNIISSKYTLYPAPPDVMQTVHSRIERSSSPLFSSMGTDIPYSNPFSTRMPLGEGPRPHQSGYLYPYGGIPFARFPHQPILPQEYPRPMVDPQCLHEGPTAMHDPYKAKVVMPQFTGLRGCSGVIDLDKIDIISGRVKLNTSEPNESRDLAGQSSTTGSGNSTVTSDKARIMIKESLDTDVPIVIKVEDTAVSPKLNTTVFQAKRKRLDMLMGKLSAQVNSEPPSAPPVSNEATPSPERPMALQASVTPPADDAMFSSDTAIKKVTAGLTKRSTFYLEGRPGASRPVDLVTEKLPSTLLSATPSINTTVTVYPPISPQKPPMTYIQSGYPGPPPPPYPQHREMLRFLPPEHRDLTFHNIRPLHSYSTEYIQFPRVELRPPPSYPGIPVSGQYTSPVASYYNPYDMMHKAPQSANNIRSYRPGYSLLSRARYVPMLPQPHDRSNSSVCQIPDCKCRGIWTEHLKSIARRSSPSTVQQSPSSLQQSPSSLQQSPSTLQQSPSTAQQSPSMAQQSPSMPQQQILTCHQVPASHLQPITSTQDMSTGGSPATLPSILHKESQMTTSQPKKPITLPLFDRRSKRTETPVNLPKIVPIDPSELPAISGGSHEQKSIEERDQKAPDSVDRDPRLRSKQKQEQGKERKKDREKENKPEELTSKVCKLLRDKAKGKAQPLKNDIGTKKDPTHTIISPSKDKKEKDHVLAPREFVVELDPSEFRCTVKGCDKTFRKSSFLDYHLRYYHSPRVPTRRRRSSNLSVSSPDSVSNSALGSPNEIQAAFRKQQRPAILDSPGMRTPNEADNMSIRSGYASSVSAMTDDNLSDAEKGDVSSYESDDSDFESLGSRVADDVIRCTCQTDDEMGFMIQCEQCLTWQHGDCVELSVESVPSDYLCYVCSNPKGLRPGAKYANNFEWYRRGKLPKLSSSTEKTTDTINDIMMASHGLMADICNVFEVLRGIKRKLALLKESNHPLLKYWRGRSSGCRSTKDDLTDRNTSSTPSSEKDTNFGVKKLEKTKIDTKHESENINNEINSDKVEKSTQEGNDKKNEDKDQNNKCDDNRNNKHPVLHKADDKPVLDRELERGNLPESGKETAVGHKEMQPEKGSRLDSTNDDIITSIPEVSFPEDTQTINAQMNLLNHIQQIEEELSSRMDEMENQLDILEEEYDKIERDGKENTLPKQLKYRIPDISCLVHQLYRINRYLVDVS